jgi:hypothetical protein
MNTRGFGVDTPRDLLESAKFEIDHLEEVTSRTYPSESEAKHTIGSASEKCAFA